MTRAVRDPRQRARGRCAPFPPTTPTSAAPTPSTAWTGPSTWRHGVSAISPSGRRRQRPVSPRPARPSSSTRACAGPQPRHHHRARVDQCRGPARRPALTRPPGTRVDTATATPAPQCAAPPSTMASVPALPEPSASSTMPRAPAATHGVHRHGVAAGVAGDHVHPGRVAAAEQRRGTAAACRRSRLKRSATDRRRAANPPRPRAHLRQCRAVPAPSPAKLTSTPRPRAAGLAATVERVAQIRRTVGIGRVGAAQWHRSTRRAPRRRRSARATARSPPWCRCRG